MFKEKKRVFMCTSSAVCVIINIEATNYLSLDENLCIYWGNGDGLKFCHVDVQFSL